MGAPLGREAAPPRTAARAESRGRNAATSRPSQTSTECLQSLNVSLSLFLALLVFLLKPRGTHSETRWGALLGLPCSSLSGFHLLTHGQVYIHLSVREDIQKCHQNWELRRWSRKVRSGLCSCLVPWARRPWALVSSCRYWGQ